MRINNNGSNKFFKKHWLLILILSAGAFVYQRAIKSKEYDVVEMTYRLHELEKEKYIASQEKEDLLLQIHSQSDPAWIELILKKKLGVVPDGQMKVHFTNQTSQ